MITIFSGRISRWRFAAGMIARMIVVGMVLGAPVVSHAAIRCIENESQVKSTLDAALASAEVTEEVRIKSGLYNFTTGSSGYFGVLEGTGKALSIRGGWSGTAGNCTTQDGDSASTIFYGNNQRPVFGINASTTFTGSITVENMFFGGGLTSSGSSPSCLTLGQQNGGVMGIVVDRVWLEGCTTAVGVSAPAVGLSSDSALVMRNSLVVGNNSGTSPPVVLVVRAGLSNLVLNNTIAKNTSADSAGWAGLFVSASNGATLKLANNLLDGNVATAGTRKDIRIVGTAITLQNNRYTGLDGIPSAESGSSTGSAGFNGNGYDLAAASTARDAGAFFIPFLQGTLDAAATARVQGSAVDLGALEYQQLFKDGFESP